MTTLPIRYADEIPEKVKWLTAQMQKNLGLGYYEISWDVNYIIPNIDIKNITPSHMVEAEGLEINIRVKFIAYRKVSIVCTLQDDGREPYWVMETASNNVDTINDAIHSNVTAIFYQSTFMSMVEYIKSSSLPKPFDLWTPDVNSLKIYQAQNGARILVDPWGNVMNGGWSGRIRRCGMEFRNPASEQIYKFLRNVSWDDEPCAGNYDQILSKNYEKI